MKNPFSVKTPETLTAHDIASLFIDVFSDFPRLLECEHTFLHGPRGTGKSMMLRYLEPQVQLAANKVDSAHQLNYYAVHMPIKKANYSLGELDLLEGTPYWLLSEHFMLVNATIHILDSLKDLALEEDSKASEWSKFCADFLNLAGDLGCDLDEIPEHIEGSACIELFRKMCERELRFALKYLRDIAFSGDKTPYQGTLFGYADFFLPFVRLVKSLEVTPDGPIFLMMDDADNLPERMQMVLNGWVSYRTTNDLCLKISTQQRYKTWRTTQGLLIESPHDYSEIDINTVYTSKSGSHYYDRIQSIAKRRLELYGLNDISPEDFFPESTKQKEALDAVKKSIGERWESGEKVSNRKSDDITRYAFSEYLKNLAKVKKTNTLSYAGFRSMVDVSSGMVRFFLEPASRMYSEMIASNCELPILKIPPQLQDKVLDQWSQEFIIDDIDKLSRTDASRLSAPAGEVSGADKFKNLINAFGECFQQKLMSNDTERRLFSFMLTREPDSDTQRIIDLAIEWGYLHRSTIARKEGIGRNKLYILNRRLAPYFRLDPSGYAAYLSVTPEDLSLACSAPRAFVRKRLSKSNSSKQVVSGMVQDDLFKKGEQG